MHRFLFVLVVVVAVAETKKLPNYIKPCKKDDPNLNECAKKSGLEALPILLKGDKEYKNPNLTPLLLPKLEIAAGGSLTINFKDVTLYGLDTVDFKGVNIDLDKRIIDVHVAFSRLNLQGEYDMNGKVLVLPIEGKGPANITFEGVDVDCAVHYNLIKKKDGKEYLDSNTIKPVTKYTLKKAYYHFENLFNGDKVLGEQTNKFLNDHYAEINEDLGESISQTISAIVISIIQHVITVVPYNEIFI